MPGEERCRRSTIIGAGKGMGLDPEIDVAGQFSEQDILVKPIDVIPVPENGQIDVAVGVIGVLGVGPVKVQTPDGDFASLQGLEVLPDLLID